MDDFFDLDSIINEIDKRREFEDEKKDRDIRKQNDEIERQKYTYQPLEQGKEHTIEEKLSDSMSKNLRSKKNKELIDGLSMQQLKSIEMTIEGYKPSDIADECGVTTATLRNWKKRNDYAELLEKTRKDYMETYSNFIVSKVPLAINTLVKAMEEGGWREKVASAKTILEYSNIKKNSANSLESAKNGINKPTLIVVNPSPPQQNQQSNIFEDVIENESDEDVIDVDID